MFASLYEQISNDQISSFNVVNGEDIFEWKANFSSPLSINPEDWNYINIRYNKPTGVQLYSERESFIDGNYYNLVLRQKLDLRSPTLPESKSSVFGFGLIMTFVGIMAIITIVRRKR